MKCSSTIRIDDWNTTRPCRNEAKVTYNGKQYCGIHDPNRRARLREANEAKRPRCPKCMCRKKPWWKYCPICGTKFV